MKSRTRGHWLARLFPQSLSRKLAGRSGAGSRVGLELLEDRLAPATFTWTGLGADTNWSTKENWAGNIAPTGLVSSNLDNLVFPGGVSVLNSVNDLPIFPNTALPTFGNITISGNGYRISGLPIVLGSQSVSGSGSIFANASTTNNNLQLNIQLGGAAASKQFFTVNSSADLTISGQLSGNTGSELTKNGTGVLILSANNTGFTGPITLDNNSGVLRISNSNALGDTTGATRVGANSQLQLDNVGGPIPETLILNGSGISTDGALLNRNGNNVWSGPVILDSDSFIGAEIAGAAATLTINGVVSDLGAGHNLTKEGLGTIILTAANTYRGTTTINNGILRIANALALGASGSAQNGTIVTRTLTKSGQLEVQGPVGGGFTVLDEHLTLNGLGGNGLGALRNIQGDNQWAGTVVLGSVAPNGLSPRVGVASGSTLLISSVISSPNGVYSLTKVDSGKLIFNNANTYTGGTAVLTGILNIRDSSALSTGAVVVSSGASLELEVDTGTDPHGRNLGLDSVTGVSSRLQIGNTLTISGTGVGGTGALRSISGINVYTAGITLNGTGGIGVESDPTPSNTNLYFANDYSLTVTGTVSSGNLVKVGTGHLILPNANTYTGSTQIQQGWITVQNNNSLGPLSTGSDTIQSQAIVSAGASLMLKPLTAGASFSFLKRLVLAGTGIVHPFGLISQKGALMSLGGDNTVGGTEFSRSSDIQLNGTAGIGVELLAPDTFSTLTITSTITNFGASNGGITKLGSQVLVLQGDGTYSGSNTVSEGVLRVQNNTSLGSASTGTTATGNNTYTTTTTSVGRGIAELQSLTIGGTPGTYTLTFNGQTTGPISTSAAPSVIATELNALSSVSGVGGVVSVNQSGNVYMVTFGGTFVGFNQPTLIVNSSGGPNITVTTLMNGDGAAIQLQGTVGWLNGGLATGLNIWNESLVLNSPGNTAFNSGALTILGNDNLWRGGVVLTDSATVQVARAARLTVFGGISDATNPLASGSDLTLIGGGKLALGGAGSYRGTTNVSNGILVLENSQALGSTGNDEIQTVTVSGDPSGSFTLNFNGQTTPSLSATATPAEVANALNALSSVGTVGGSVSVSLVGSVYTIQFGGNFSGFNQPTLVALGAGGTNVAVNTIVQGAGGTIVTDGSAIELQGSLAIAGEPLIIQGRGGPNLSSQQTVTLLGEQTGTFNLTFNGATTVDLPVGSSAVAVQTALNNLPTIGGVGGAVSVTGKGISEIQTVTGTGTAGTFTLTFNGATTGVLPFDASETQVQTELNNLTSIGGVGGSVTVVRGGTAEVQQVNPFGFGGGARFRLSFKGQQTNLMQINVSAAQLETELNALSTISGVGGFVTVVQNGNSFDVTFGGSLDVGDQPALVASGQNGGGAFVSETAKGTLTWAVTFGGTLGFGLLPLMTAAGTGGAGATVARSRPGSAEPFYDVSFIGSFAGTPQPLMKGTGSAGVNVLITTPTNVPTGWFNEGPSPANTFPTPGNQSVSGRVTGVVADPSDSNVMYVSTAAGGVWKTKDGAKTWQPVFDFQNGQLEVQQLTITGTTGSFTLEFNGATTISLPVGATGRDVQDALNNLSTIGGEEGAVTVTRLGNVYTITFTGDLSTQDVSPIVAVGSGGAGATIATLADGIESTSPMYIGTITFDGTNRTIYIGTGETTNAPDSYYGSGIYRSNDAGRHWTLVSGTQLQAILVSGAAGTFNISFRNETTADLPLGETAANVQAALNGLTTINTGGGSVNVTRTLVSEVQTITVTATSGTITYTFNGQSTAALPYNDTAVNVQNALNALSSISGVGGSVTVTLAGTVYTVTFGGALQAVDVPLITTTAGATVAETTKGSYRYDVTFNGPLASQSLPVMIAVGSGGATASASIVSQYNPFDGKGISKIIFDPNTNILYAASGDGGSGRDEVQQIRPNVFTGQTFTLTFTGQDATGTVVSLTTVPIVYDNSNAAARTQTALDIQNALNALGNIGGIGGLVVVTPPTGGGGGGGGGFRNNRYTITFGGSLALTNVQELTGNPPPPPNNPSLSISTVRDGGAGKVINGTSGGAGVWRLDTGGTWVNLTTIVSTNRASVTSSQAQPPTAGASPYNNPPRNAGPDDDYRVEFPDTNATYSDIALIYTDTSNVGTGVTSPVLYIALGSSNGDVNNGVFWSKNPNSATPVWYVGAPGGTDANPATAPTGVDVRSSGQFPVGQFATDTLTRTALSGNIKIAAIAGSTLITTTVYASVATPTRTLRGIWKTTNGGHAWSQITVPSYLASQGDYANSIYATNANTVYVGGFSASFNQHILRTTDGGTSWTDISVGGNGNGPQTAVHSIISGAGGILIGTDGGPWRLENSGNWTDLNGNLGISQINGIASHPTDLGIVYVGLQSNGTAKFTNNLAWTVTDGSGGGEIRLDPINPNNVYHVQLIRGGNAIVRRSIDAGATWSTILNTSRAVVPLYLDPINPARLLVGGLGVQESVNQGNGWSTLGTISTSNVVTELAAATYQGAFVADLDFPQVVDKGNNIYDPDTIYTTDGDNVYLTKNHGLTWVDRTTDLTGFGAIVDLAVDPRNRDTIYAVRNAFGGGKIFQSTDAGQTWADITSNLPDLPAWKVVIDPRTGDLYLGTDQGVYFLENGTDVWKKLGSGMPNVQVRDLELNQNTNTLRAATYGRGVYLMYLDDSIANAGALRATSGNSVWTGKVLLVGDSINNSVIISANGTQALQNGIATATLNISGTIDDLVPGSNTRLIKVGQGDVILSGTNTYEGVTEVQEGVLVIQNAKALGSSAAPTIVNPGTALELESDLELEPVTLNGNGFQFNGRYTGALRNVSNNNTYTGTLTLATGSTIGVDSNSSLTVGTKSSLSGEGTITDNGANLQLTKELTGTLILASQNSYGGLTEIYAGAIQVQHAGALGSTTAGTNVLNGAQLQIQTPTTGPLAGQPVVVVDELLRLSGTGIFGTGALLNTGGDNTWAGPINLQSLPGFLPQNAPPGIVSFGVSTAGDELTIDQVISQNIATGIAKVGLGTLILAQNNTYSGTTYVDQGSIRVQSTGALGTTNTNEIQRISVGGVSTGSFTVSFNGQSTGALNSATTATQMANALNALTSIQAIGTVSVTRTTATTGLPGNTFTTTIYTVTFTTTPAGLNVATLSAAAINGASVSVSTVADGGIGTLVATGAALELDGDPTGIGSSLTVVNEVLALNGTGIANIGALRNVSGDNTWTGDVVLQSNTAIGADPTTQITITGQVRDPANPTPVPAANLTKVSDGTVVFTNANPYGGKTFIDAGILNIQNAGSLGTTGPEVQTVTLTVTGTVGSFVLTFNGQSTAPLAYNVPASGGVGIVASVENALNALSTIGGVGGNVSVTQSGNVYTITFGGSLALTNENQITAQGFNGVATVATTLRDGPEGTVVANGATLQLANGITVSTEALTINGAGFNNIGALNNGAGNNQWNGIIILGSDSAIGVDMNTDRLSITQPITDNLSVFGVTKVGPGILQYSAPTANTYTGLTQVNGGTLELGMPTNIDAMQGNLVIGDGTTNTQATVLLLGSQQLPDTTQVVVNNNGTLNLNLQTETIDSLSILDGAVLTGDTGVGGSLTVTTLDMVGGTITLNDAGSTLILSGVVTANSSANGSATIEGNGSVSLNGTTRIFNVADGPAAIDLEITAPITATATEGVQKLGNGVMAIGSNANTYTGITQITAGTLLVNGTIGDVLIDGGVLGGTGTVGTVTSSGNGSVSPGVTTGTLVTGNVTLTPTDEVFVDLANSPLGHDLLDVRGDIDLAGANLAGKVDSGVGIGDTFTVITATGNITGSFSQGTSAFVDGLKFAVTYNRTGPIQSVVLERIKNTVTMVLASSVASPVYGQSVIFTATLTPEPGAGNVSNSESVTFTLDGNNYVVSVNNGVATFDPSIVLGGPLTVGLHTISASFAGNADFFPASAGPLNVTVNKANSGVSLGSSSPSSVFGQAVTITATVTAQAPGAGIPSGQVTFLVDGTPFGIPVSLVGGVATISLPTNLGIGSHTISASYTGDGNFNSSATPIGSEFIQTVSQAVSSVALISAPAPSVFGQSVTFTATVTVVSPGSGTPTGTVTFREGGTVLAVATLGANGNPANVASFTTTALIVGAHNITATYNGNANITTGTTNYSHTVNKANTGILIASSNTPSVYGQTVIITATVQPVAPGAGVPTGQVSFLVDGVAFGSPVNLVNGAAAISLPVNLAVGTHLIRASYSGDASFNIVTSPTDFSQVVNKATTTVGLVSSPAPSTYGQTVTFSATVSPVAPGSGVPTGTVTFMEGSTVLATANLGANGNPANVASFNISSLVVGPHTITATYNADNNFTTSTTAYSHTVNKANTSVVISSSKPTSKYGEPVTITVNVVPLAPATGIPTGLVSFQLDGANFGSAVVLSNGTASISLPLTLASGIHKIGATYTGDSNFSNTSTPTGTEFNQTVVPDTTAVALVATPSPSVYSENVVFTATVTGTATGTPSGTVTFRRGLTVLGTSTLGANGNPANVATLELSTLLVGAHTITATYNGNANFTTSNSTYTHTVNKANTSVHLTGPGGIVAVGTAVTFTATVAAQNPATGIPTGTVTFVIDNGLPQPTFVNASGVATLTLFAGLTQGVHSVVATYSGDGNYNSNNDSLSQTAGYLTTTTLTSSANPSVPGQSVIMTAKVTATGGFGTPAGTVQFKLNGVAQGAPVTLVNGSATTSLSAASLQFGNNLVTATYVNTDGNFISQGEVPLTQVVAVGDPITTLTASSNPSAFGSTVTFTASVDGVGPNAPTATGTVTFTIDGANKGTFLLSGGKAFLTQTGLSIGNHVVKVSYSGDGSYTADTPDAAEPNDIMTLNHNVVTGTVVTLATNPTAPVYGQPVTLTANVTATSGSAIPTGEVIFYIDGSPSQPVTLVGGTASMTVPNFTAGTHIVTPVYTGNSQFSSSYRPTAVVVQKAATSATLASYVTAPVYGQVVRVTTIVSSSNSPLTPTGNVYFYVDGVLQGSTPLVSGRAGFNLNGLTVGGRLITVTYSDANFANTGRNLALTVSKAASTTTIQAPVSVYVGNEVLLTALVNPVSPSTTYRASGRVRFFVNGSLYATLNLLGVSGQIASQAQIRLSSLPVGTYSIVAVYDGSDSFNGSSFAHTMFVVPQPSHRV